MTLTFDRYRAEIITQAELVRAGIAGTDLSRPVPSCPGWTANQLVRHLGGATPVGRRDHHHRGGRPAGRRPLPRPDPYVGEDPAVLGDWLVEQATDLADALRAAGPDATVWTPLPTLGSRAAFHARRMAHEAVIHRADAFLALDVPFAVDPAVAVDGVDEWMELGSLPEMFEFHPHRRALLGPGRTLQFVATDIDAAWLVDRTGDALAWRRGVEPATVTVRAPVTDLLLSLYRRRPCTPGYGDGELLDFWLTQNAFG